MRRLTYLLIASLLFPVSALARQPAGGGNGQKSTDRVTGAARAAEQMSDKGQLNTNGPAAEDRDLGLDRAGDRMSDQGTDHSQATSHMKDKKETKAKKDKKGKKDKKDKAGKKKKRNY